ncbi:hypothetical protein N9411_00075 [bacterium]|nr:hypothetical protein [bacterium]
MDVSGPARRIVDERVTERWLAACLDATGKKETLAIAISARVRLFPPKNLIELGFCAKHFPTDS